MLFFPLCLLICLLSAFTASSVASSKDLDFFLAKSSLPGILILISTSLLLFEFALIIFKKTEQTNPLANFRKGDITVLYPFQNEKDTVLNNQIFKCTIVEITKEEVDLRFQGAKVRKITDYIKF